MTLHTREENSKDVWNAYDGNLQMCAVLFSGEGEQGLLSLIKSPRQASNYYFLPQPPKCQGYGHAPPRRDAGTAQPHPGCAEYNDLCSAVLKEEMIWVVCSDKLAGGQFCLLGSGSPLGSGRDPGRRPWGLPLLAFISFCFVSSFDSLLCVFSAATGCCQQSRRKQPSTTQRCF